MTDWGKRYPQALWGNKHRLTRVPKKSVKKHATCSDPISADPICPFPNADDLLRVQALLLPELAHGRHDGVHGVHDEGHDGLRAELVFVVSFVVSVDLCYVFVMLVDL